MRKKFSIEFLTRKALIQGIYSNLCEFDLDFLNKISLKEHMLSEIEFDQAMFEEIIQVAFYDWEIFEEEFNIIEYRKRKEISRCANAVLRAAFAEIALNKTDYPIIIDEYIELSKMFCAHESKLINKILDDYINKEKCDKKNYEKG